MLLPRKGASHAAHAASHAVHGSSHKGPGSATTTAAAAATTTSIFDDDYDYDYYDTTTVAPLSKGVRIAIIVGVVVGALIFLGCCITLCTCVIRSRKAKKRSAAAAIAGANPQFVQNTHKGEDQQPLVANQFSSVPYQGGGGHSYAPGYVPVQQTVGQMEPPKAFDASQPYNPSATPYQNPPPLYNGPPQYSSAAPQYDVAPHYNVAPQYSATPTGAPPFAAAQPQGTNPNYH